MKRLKMNTPKQPPNPAFPHPLVGHGRFTYEARADWARLPQGASWPEVPGVAIDSKDRVYAFHRGKDPVMVFDRDGTFLYSWGEGCFGRAHGITIGPDDGVYCADDFSHVVEKYTPEGKFLFRLGTKGRPSDTGVINNDHRTIRRVGAPFNLPTNVALAPGGEIYVSDGYGNCCVHKFSPDGRLLLSWGTPGGGPGQFRVPHGIAVNRDGLVFVADRENSRIQIFSPTGKFLHEWRDVARPCDIAFDAAGNVFVAEAGFRAAMGSDPIPPAPGATGARVSIFDLGGSLLARWGGGENPTAPGDFFMAHDISVDSHGDVYVAEVFPNEDRAGRKASDHHFLQKFSLKKPDVKG